MMTYSTDPVADAAAYYEPLYAAAEAQAKAERDMADDFLAACRKCDANALAAFAPMVNDWDAATRQPRAAVAPMPKRVQTLAEVLEESLDYGSGPSKTELMQLLLNVAYSADLVNAPTQARALLSRMADTFATNNVGV